MNKNSNEITSKNKMTVQQEKSLRYRRDRDREIVKGRFHFHERPGGNLKFNFLQYPGDPMQKHDLWDGRIYEIPRGVARHLNTSGYITELEHYQDPQGQICTREKASKRRYSFENYDFFELDDIDSPKIEKVSIQKG